MFPMMKAALEKLFVPHSNSVPIAVIVGLLPNYIAY